MYTKLQLEPIEAANRLVDAAIAHHHPVSSLALKKQLYFSQAAFLAEQPAILMDVNFAKRHDGVDDLDIANMFPGSLFRS